MKIRFDIETTPQELRTFFGLPDVEPLQKELMGKIREKMIAGADGFDAANLMKPFLPEHLQSLAAMQGAFWESFTGQADTEKKTKESD